MHPGIGCHSFAGKLMVNISIVFSGEEFFLNDDVKVIPSPGHTVDDVSVVVQTQDLGTVVIAGKYFFYVLCILSLI